MEGTTIVSTNEPTNVATNPTNDDGKRGPGFSQVENILICKAFITASEDPIIGRSQKGKAFKALLFAHYCTMIDNQSRCNSKTVMAQASGTTWLAYEGALVGTSMYPKRKERSVFERFTKKIAPEVCKFIDVLHTTAKESGMTDEDHYGNCLAIFKQRYGGSFDLEECYYYLKHKATFLLFKQRVDGDDEKQEKAKQDSKPIGNKAANKAQQNAALTEQVIDEDNPNSDISDGSVASNGRADSQVAFYQNASLLLAKTGDGDLLTMYMQQQKEISTRKRFWDDVNPRKNKMLTETKNLYIADG